MKRFLFVAPVLEPKTIEESPATGTAGLGVGVVTVRSNAVSTKESMRIYMHAPPPKKLGRNRRPVASSGESAI